MQEPLPIAADKSHFQTERSIKPNELPLVNEANMMRMLHFIEIMGRDEERFSTGSKFPDEIPEHMTINEINSRGWFIEKHNIGIVEERARQRSALFNPAGQFSHQRSFLAAEAETGKQFTLTCSEG